MNLLFALLSVSLCAADATGSESYLLRVEKAMTACRADVPAMQAPAEEAAARLSSGGKLWAAGQASIVSEICGRAGGMMMIHPLGGNPPAAGDVVLYAAESGVQLPESFRDSGAKVVVFGDCPAGPNYVVFSNHGSTNRVSPTLANAIPAWVFCGELVAALTRIDKMPVMFETIGAYGGYARMQQYKMGEIPFHDDKKVPAVPAGMVGNAFLDSLTAKLRRIEKEERAGLDKAGAWAQEAAKNGHQAFMYCMGHLLPDEIGKSKIGKAFKFATWSAGFRQPHPEDSYSAGDFAALIGYQHPASELLRKARPAGARVVYVSVLSDRDFANDSEVVWLDPMWDWQDACVDIDGYDVPILPASGIVNGTVAWELYRLATGDELP